MCILLPYWLSLIWKTIEFGLYIFNIYKIFFFFQGCWPGQTWHGTHSIKLIIHVFFSPFGGKNYCLGFFFSPSFDNYLHYSTTHFANSFENWWDKKKIKNLLSGANLYIRIFNQIMKESKQRLNIKESNLF